MTLRTANKRRTVRAGAAYRAVIRNRKGRVLARGRTANISANGVFIIASCPKGPPKCSEVLIEMEVPTATASRTGRPATRTVHYLCRVIRIQTLGHLMGMGVEFLEEVG